jgi:lactate dehydrogenase-like 2-hydroxyacid dehydrogenase
LQLHPIHKSAEEGLPERYEVTKLHEVGDKDAFLAGHGAKFRAVAGGSIGAELMDKLPNLEIIISPGVGYDGVDVEAARARNIRVTNTPDVLNDAMAEITIGLMIALSRRLPQADRFVREGKWPAGDFGLQSELRGKTVGILGLGRIGKEIARLCGAMKMRVVYFGRHRQEREPYIYYDKLSDMARDSDWLVIIAPGGPDTRHIVTREVMEALGPKGRLVNMARGSLVDEPAMVELLQSGALGGAALDVFDKEPHVPQVLSTLDNVVLSPHQGSATLETRHDMGMLMLDNLEAHFAGKPLPTPVV